MSLPVVQPLAWDSKFLGFSVGRLDAQSLGTADLANLLKQSQAAGIRLIYLMCAPADTKTAEAAQAAGAWLADRKVTFVRSVTASPLGADSGLEAPYIARVTAFTPQLEQLAWQSGEFSRFRRDSKFAPNVFIRLYTHWLHASLKGELAQAVLVSSQPAGLETGLLTLAEQGSYANIGLLAVETMARGHGLGKALVEATVEEAQNWGCTHLRVATQRDNVRACRFYAQCGFELIQEEHIYHLWL